MGDLLQAIGDHAEITGFRVMSGAPGSRPLVVMTTTGFLGGPELRRHCHEQGKAADFDTLTVDDVVLDLLSPDELSKLVADSSEGAFSRFVTPEGDLETQLVTMWESLLDFTPIGVLDDFVEIGGESMSALEIVVQVSQRWGRDLNLVDVVDAACIRNLARLITASPVNVDEI
ncbi:phosphopantetheine-binding protein [Streptomyces sp. NPDC051554]|uniref:phosphopantetheine-binding protein n=1 Tax=Streptomyces sp. NPDC051554 TaxID=3365656 RepID=UPI0037BC9F39